MLSCRLKMIRLIVYVVVLLLVAGHAISLNPSLNDDLLGLIVFKADIQDPDGKLESWNEDDNSPCGWVGVRCNPRSNRVTDLTLDGFGLSGRIGRGILQLQFLRKLSLANNNLTGSLAFSLAQLENLRVVDLSQNSLGGPIPRNFFSQCGSLRSLSLANNKFSGHIPDSLSSCFTLGYLNFSGNQFSGLLPSGIWDMQGLRSLDLSSNLLEGEIPKGIEGANNLRKIQLEKNQLTGEVPEGIGNCFLLRSIDFSENSFSGLIPRTLQMLTLCNNLDLHRNSFIGEVPEWIGEMKSLESLDLSENSFSGPMPSALGDISSLQYLNLSRNFLKGCIPDSIQKLKALDVLDLSRNKLTGSIPTKIGEAVSLRKLLLEMNFLSGDIPTSIEKCTPLTSLILSRNSMTGSIPVAFAKLTNLQTVDLSYNKFTGPLPKQLANLAHLISFNISHNQVQGELPAGGFFNTISPSSLSGNPSLCGAAVNKSCPAVLPKPIVLNPNSSDSNPDSIPVNPGHKKIILSISALIAIGAAATIIIGVIAITVLNLRVRSSTSHSAAAFPLSGGDGFSSSPSSDGNSGKLVMFSGDPDFSTGAHALLNKDCELGRGGFGAVYRTVLKDGRSVAIKKLTVSSLVKSQDDFEREVKKLGKIHHRNLVALEGYYWTPSLQLLIYEFVSGGSLYKHLHEGSGGNFLSWNERFTIILGIAKSLVHLHHLNIIHYNLKSSNILIDSSGEPKVADSGLARLLPMLDRYILSSKIQSALGYMAPEFGCKTVKITEKCDVYGFGVLVLEVVTGRRPVEYMEDDVVVLRDMVRGALEEGRVEECVDERLKDKFPPDEAIPVIKLGLICTSQVPSNRPDMAEVINILELIRCPSEGQEELV